MAVRFSLASSQKRRDLLSEDRRSRGRPRKLHDLNVCISYVGSGEEAGRVKAYLAPNVARMFIHQSLGRIAEEKF